MLVARQFPPFFRPVVSARLPRAHLMPLPPAEFVANERYQEFLRRRLRVYHAHGIKPKAAMRDVAREVNSLFVLRSLKPLSRSGTRTPTERATGEQRIERCR